MYQFYGAGVGESPQGPMAAAEKNASTIVRGVAQAATCICDLKSGVALLDASAARSPELHAGPNDISTFEPGVYFVRFGVWR